jgi:hypothetical protein
MYTKFPTVNLGNNGIYEGLVKWSRFGVCSE